MSSLSGVPVQASLALSDLLDRCAEIQPGQHVVILAAAEGIYGGPNLVDERVIDWIQAGIQQRRAYPWVMWVNLPERPSIVWKEGSDELLTWQLPEVLKAVMKSADVVISHLGDLSVEEELKEVPQFIREHRLRVIRNMASTAALMASDWAATPWELVSELRYQAVCVLQPGLHWRLTHPNGTYLEGTTIPSERYGTKRNPSRPFPEGIFPALVTDDAEGIVVYDRTGTVWARHIGIPPCFRSPVRVTVEKGLIRKFEGGEEAKVLTKFYTAMARHLEEAAYHVRGVHGGVHPFAMLASHQCPDQDHREFIEHHHWSSVHVHLGNSLRTRAFPYNMHVSAELRGATLQVGSHFLYQDGRLGVIDHPAVRAVAERYQDRANLVSRALAPANSH